MSRNDFATAIEVQVEDLAQLFDSLDPFPFRERGLDKSAEEYIVSWARELPSAQPIEIIIYVSAPGTANTADVQTAIQKHFLYRADLAVHDLSELFREGRRSLLIGLAVLAVCVIARELFLVMIKAEGLGRILNEGFLILGWVANWRPLEIFLYDWWPLARRRNLFRRLSNATVLIVARDQSAKVTSNNLVACQLRKVNT